MEEANGYEGAERRAHPRFHMTFPAIEDAKEGRGVDLGVEIVTEKKRIKARELRRLAMSDGFRLKPRIEYLLVSF